MKKFSFTLLLFTLYAGTFAQYKKASFFEKAGRTYALGSRLNALGDGKGGPIGFYISFGRDQDGKRLFTNWDLQYIPGFKFSKNVLDEDKAVRTIRGKSRAQFIYGYNWGYHLIKGEGETPRIQPYLTAGFNFVISGGVKEWDDYYTNTDPYISERSFGVGIGGGAGAVFNLSSWFGLNLAAGYNLQGNIATDGDYAQKAYHMYTSHPYVSAGVRFRISSDD
ncbi:hypothetical protein [Paraflavitalea pollutisoli]|uniref:hypothetical protein n=1 Tax=Paraflavitalea pollutisoli TaxID=3034143 RepID=UPI0023EB8A8D|nr:hypothetical protein [Paraflavitalea sp. H1-2-19X]